MDWSALDLCPEGQGGYGKGRQVWARCFIAVACLLVGRSRRVCYCILHTVVVNRALGFEEHLICCPFLRTIASFTLMLPPPARCSCLRSHDKSHMTALNMYTRDNYRPRLVMFVKVSGIASMSHQRFHLAPPT
jgi:hypothetical protein